MSKYLISTSYEQPRGPGSTTILHGFTLIELLVVVAIIALLVSILLPSLHEARELARSVVCQTRMQQLALGYHLYVHDNDGHVPHRYFTPPTKTWINLLEPYLDWDCQQYATAGDGMLPFLTDPSILIPAMYESSLAYWHTSYALNNFAAYNTSEEPWDGGSYGNPQGILEQKRPAETFMFTPCPEPYHSSFSPGSASAWAMVILDRETIHVATGLYLFDFIYRHSEGFNAAYMDGHVERVEYPAPMETGVWYRELPYSSAYE